MFVLSHATTYQSWNLHQGYQGGMVENKELYVRSRVDLWVELVQGQLLNVVMLLYRAVELGGPRSHRKVTQVVDKTTHHLEK